MERHVLPWSVALAFPLAGFFYKKKDIKMSVNKKYFYLKLKENFFDRSEIKTIEGMQNGYLKLKENFFDRSEIKAIEGMQNGYEYICIMQKMYLRSLSREGQLMLTDKVPYDYTMLSNVLNHEEDAIKRAIEIFCDLGLCQISYDKRIYMKKIQDFI
jgi:predicted phage replisome organizer